MKKHKIAVPVVMYCRGVLPVRSLVGMTAVVGLCLIWLSLVPGAACAEEDLDSYTPCSWSAGACYNFNRPTIGSLVFNLMGSDVPYIPPVVDLAAGDAIKIDGDEGYSMLFAAFAGGGTTTLNGTVTVRLHPDKVAAGKQCRIEAGDEFYLVWSGPGKFGETNYDAATLAYGPGFGLDLPDLTLLGLEWAPPDITSQHVRVWTVPGPDPPAVPQPVVREPEPPVVPQPDPPAVREPEPVVVPGPDPPVVREPQPVVVPEPQPVVVPAPDPPAVPEPNPPVVKPARRSLMYFGDTAPAFDLDIFAHNATFTAEGPPIGEPWGPGKVFQLLGPTHGEVVGFVAFTTGLVAGDYTQVYMSGFPEDPVVSVEGPISIYTFDPDPANPPASYEPVNGDVFHLIVTGGRTGGGFFDPWYPKAELTFPDLDSLFNFDNAPLAEGLSWRPVITPSGGLDLLVVPEPGTLVLLITGALGLLLLVWRRRRRS